MTGRSDIDDVWDIAETIKTCMLTTLSAGRLRSRPMHALPDRDANSLWFITDQRGAKEDEIRAAPDVCLAFADTRSNTYLSMTGRATMTRDPDKARQLWSSEAQAWWPKGPSDPDVRVLCVNQTLPNTGIRGAIRSSLHLSSQRRDSRETHRTSARRRWLSDNEPGSAQK